MLYPLFNPKSVAVIGASSKEMHIGNRIIKNLLYFGYKGSVYPINTKADKICGINAYKSVLDVSEEIDVAHIVIPAKFVPIAVEDCGKKGIKVVIINSGGFSEAGDDGAAIQKKLLDKAKKYNIRVLGPNCQGIINSDPKIRAYCNFTFTFPEAGSISIVALSGGVAELIHQGLIVSGSGTRIYASSGNECDISISEIIRYLGSDDLTRVIITYVEGLKDNKEFMKTVEEVSVSKPILAMKAGRTIEGAKAAASHTGGLATKDMVTDLIFKKAGVLDFNSENRMINAAVVLSTQPVPKGNKVGIITNTGGPAVIATDVLVDAGLVIPRLSNQTIDSLKNSLHKEASFNNPVDVLATGTADHFMVCLKAMMADDNIDSIFLSFVTPFFVDTDSIALEVVKASSKKIKPIICNLMTDSKKWSSTINILKRGGVPCFSFPSDAANALGDLDRYRRISSNISGEIKEYDVDRELVSEIFESAIINGQNYLSAHQVYSILEAYGIRSPKWSVCNDIVDVVEATNNIGYPVVIKVDSSSIIHKSDFGGVALNLCEEVQVRNFVEKMTDSVEDNKLRFLVQKYIPSDIELILGASFEDDLGYAIMFGLGGIFVEIFKDVIFNLAPITDLEALKMVESIKGFEILSGARGRKSININLIVELIQRLSQLVTDFTQIKELDFNPVVFSGDKLVVLDARILLKK